MNIDPSNSFDVLLGIPAIKALGLELKIKKEYELRPTYGPLRIAECSKAEQDEAKQTTALKQATLYKAQQLPQKQEEVWQVVSTEIPLSEAEL